MNLINSLNYSDLKSQTNVIKIISELYNEDMSINFKEDFKEQLLSNIQRKLNNTLLVKVLFTIFVHELEIKENSSEFDDIKSSILAMLKKDQNVETFDCFIKHISCLYNKYDSILIGNIICKNNNIYEYINNFTDPSLIEDKILEEISLNLNTMQFYLDFFEFLNFEPGKFIHLFSNLDFYNENLLSDVINNKEIQESLITAIFKLLLLKIECLPNYSANKDIKFNDRYLEYFLSEYINNNVYFSSLYFDSGDLKKIHYFKSSFLSSFIENQISIIYQDPNIHFLLNVHNFNKDIKKGFFMKFNKIKEIIKFSENRDFHKSIFNFLFNNFPIKYSMLFINPCVNDFISSDFLEEIRYNNHNISDVKIKDSDISSIIFKNESKKIIDFLVSGNMKKKIEQYCTYQEYPFNYCFFISDFILIYKNQSHYINTNIEDEGTIVFNPSNQIVDDMNNACSYSEVKENNENIELSHKNNNFPLKISEYSNYKIDNFIKSLYTNNSEQSEINKKIGNFCSKLNIRQFQYFIDSIALYHTNNNLSFNRDDKKNIALNILTILLENKINNYEEYRNILIYSISGYSKLNTTLSYKLNNNANKYDEEVLENLLRVDRKEEDDDSVSLFSFEENEDDESFEENNKQEEPITIFSEDNTDDNEDINLKPINENDMSNIMEIINEMSEKINNKGEKNYVKEVEPKEDVVSDEPLYEIFSAESEIEIQSYAEDLGDEGKGVKNQLRRIRKTGNKRYLQSSSKFFEKVDKLRDNFPNFEEFITSIEDYSILNQLGDNHFYIPPSLLVGDPGIGKTFFLSELSDTIGIENKMIHMETMSASWLLVGASSQWKDAKPGIVYDNIIKSKYANNIFILDELDKMMKSNYPVDNCLLQLFEKHTAKEFKDEYIPLKLDISKIIWLATANTLSTISDPILSRLQTYKIANPNFNERKKLAQNIYNHMLAENTWGSHFNPIIPDATLDKLCEPSDSIREMKKVLLKAITHSARRNDNVITIEDIISVNTTSKNKIGFM